RQTGRGHTRSGALAAVADGAGPATRPGAGLADRDEPAPAHLAGVHVAAVAGRGADQPGDLVRRQPRLGRATLLLADLGRRAVGRRQHRFDDPVPARPQSLSPPSLDAVSSTVAERRGRAGPVGAGHRAVARSGLAGVPDGPVDAYGTRLDSSRAIAYTFRWRTAPTPACRPALDGARSRGWLRRCVPSG